MDNGTKFIENGENGNSRIYDSILVDHSKIDILSNKLTMEIIGKLANSKLCAMDIARELKQHEQKIYYHLRRLEEAGIIKKVGTEKRLGMVAKMYTAVSPIVATKLYDDGHEIGGDLVGRGVDPKVLKFLHPFVERGKLNAKIVLGNPYPHGKFGVGSKGSVHAFDFGLFLGNFIKHHQFPTYCFDTDKNIDLKENLILIDGPRTNIIANKFNSKFPIQFDVQGGWSINSKITGKRYMEDSHGIILKYDNPLNKNSKILWISGIRSKGTKAGIIALTHRLDDVIKKMDENGNVIRIVEGVDKQGGGVIDFVKFLE